MRVPRPGVDSMVTRPPTAATRSWMLVSPTPAGTASRSNPAPSSRTSKQTLSSRSATVMWTAAASPACLRGVLDRLQAAEIHGVSLCPRRSAAAIRRPPSQRPVRREPQGRAPRPALGRSGRTGRYRVRVDPTSAMAASTSPASSRSATVAAAGSWPGRPARLTRIRRLRSRCWAPSWMSRSIHLRSLSALAAIRARESCSSRKSRSVSAARRWLSSVSAAHERGGVAERWLVSERRVVDQAADDPVSVPDLGQTSPGAGRRRRQRLPLVIDPAARAAIDDFERRVLERVRQRAPQLLGRQRAPQPSRQPTQRRADIHPPAHQADQERHGHGRNGERDQPDHALHERRARPRQAHAQGDAQQQGPSHRNREHRRERPPAQPGRATDAAGEPSDDRHEEPDRQQHLRGAHELLDDARLMRHDHERVVRTVRTATHPRGRRRVALNEQRRGEEEQRDEQHGRRRQRPIHTLREATGREGQDQVDQRRLDSPVHHAPGAVEHRVVGQRERDGQDPAPVATSSRPKRSNGGRLHAISPTATGSPTATARAAVSSTTAVDDDADAGTRTDTTPTATAAPIPTMSSRLELRTAGPSSTQAPTRSTHPPRRAGGRGSRSSTSHAASRDWASWQSRKTRRRGDGVAARLVLHGRRSPGALLRERDRIAAETGDRSRAHRSTGLGAMAVRKRADFKRLGVVLELPP